MNKSKSSIEPSVGTILISSSLQIYFFQIELIKFLLKSNTFYSEVLILEF